MSIPENVNLNCPTWCTTDHARWLGEELATGIISHEVRIGTVEKAGVALTVCDSADGRTGPLVSVYSGDALTPAGARKLAGLLVDAAAVAEVPVPPAAVVEWPPADTCPACGSTKLWFLGLVGPGDERPRMSCEACGKVSIFEVGAR